MIGGRFSCKRIASPTTEFPRRKAVITALINRLKQEPLYGSWASFELEVEGGWIKNALLGKCRWIQVAVDEDGFKLNAGFQKGLSLPPIPWPEFARSQWKVPLADATALIDWIDDCFTNSFGAPPERKLTGWIEG